MKSSIRWFHVISQYHNLKNCSSLTSVKDFLPTSILYLFSRVPHKKCLVKNILFLIVFFLNKNYFLMHPQLRTIFLFLSQLFSIFYLSLNFSIYFLFTHQLNQNRYLTFIFDISCYAFLLFLLNPFRSVLLNILHIIHRT
jgi:hypothetical protein